MANKKSSKKKRFLSVHVTTTISISLVLFLMGLLCLLLLGARSLSVRIKENVKLSVVLDTDADKTAIMGIKNHLEASPFVKSVEYISKEKALNELVTGLGENPEDFLGYNPLLASLEVSLNPAYANKDSVAVLETSLKALKKVNRIIYQADLMSFVNENLKKIGVALLAISLVLLLISFVLINNAIRLTLHSDRFLINTMKLVGANSWFIRKPYIKRWVVSGFVASLLAITYLTFFFYYLQSEFGFEEALLSPPTIIFVALFVISMGVLLASSSANYAVKRYIELNTNDIYSL